MDAPRISPAGARRRRNVMRPPWRSPPANLRHSPSDCCSPGRLTGFRDRFGPTTSDAVGRMARNMVKGRKAARINRSSRGEGPPSLQNPWNWFLLALAAAGIVGGLVMSVLPVGPWRSTAFWFVLPIPLLAIVGAVGWAYTEIKHYELLAPKKRPTRRVLGYFGMLLVVAAIAVGGALIPARLAPVIWTLFIPVWLIGGWWIRNRPTSKRQHRAVVSDPGSGTPHPDVNGTESPRTS